MNAMNKASRMLVVQVAALGHQLVCERAGGRLAGLPAAPLTPTFPAVTATAQATFRTAQPPSVHGMVANGFLEPRLRRVYFWEQSADLVEGPRIWERFRAAGRRVAMLFWQQSLGEAVDQILSPAPVHKHHGGMIDACYSQPADLYTDLQQKVGRRFALRHYWGPLASSSASGWIASATATLLADPAGRPDLCLTYLPGLDYDLQRFGPDHPRSRRAFRIALGQLEGLVRAARLQGYEVLVFGDYAIASCPGGAVFPNRCLAEAGWFRTRRVAGLLYQDLFASRAVAVTDHETALVYLRNPEDRKPVAALLEALPGVAQVVPAGRLPEWGLDHVRSGDLLLVAAPGHWFAYPWWRRDREAPDYARHIDIHNKPGFDPCELFFGWPPGSISRKTARVGGSHGRVGPGREAAWASTCFDSRPLALTDLAGLLRDWLDAQARPS